MAEYVSVPLSVEVEVCMVGQVDHRSFVGLGGKEQFEGIVLAPLITGDYLHVTGIASFAVLGEIHEFYGISVNAAFPNLVLEALRTAMEMVRPVVYRQSVFLSIQGELAEGNPVGKPSRAFSGTRAIGEVAHRIMIAQDDVCKLAILVRNGNADDSGTHAGKAHEGPVFICDRVKDYLLSAGGLAPGFLCNFHITCHV